MDGKDPFSVLAQIGLIAALLALGLSISLWQRRKALEQRQLREQVGRLATRIEELHQALASQGAVAEERARSNAELEERVSSLSALIQIEGAVARALDEPGALSEALAVLTQAIHCQAGIIGRRSETAGIVDVLAHWGLSGVPVRLEVVPAELFSRQCPPARVEQDFARRYPEMQRQLSSEPFEIAILASLHPPTRQPGIMALLGADPGRSSVTALNLATRTAQACSVAFGNLDHFAEMRRRTEELAALRSIGLAISSSLNLQDQLRSLYERRE